MHKRQTKFLTHTLLPCLPTAWQFHKPQIDPLDYCSRVILPKILPMLMARQGGKGDFIQKNVLKQLSTGILEESFRLQVLRPLAH